MPPACRLAGERRDRLRARVAEIEGELIRHGKVLAVSHLRDMAGDAQFAINTSLAGAVTFLRSGRWLNVREAAELSGLTGTALEAEISRRLEEWRPRRDYIEPVLSFGADVHYGSLNFGGAGAQDFGTCCLVFDMSDVEFSTCFAGDTLRVAFDESGERILSDEEILDRFGLLADRAEIAVLRHKDLLGSSGDVIDVSEWRVRFEHRDQIVEAHIHGPVTVERLRVVRMRREHHSRLQSMSLAAGEDPRSHERAEARLYRALISELSARGVLFVSVASGA